MKRWFMVSLTASIFLAGGSSEASDVYKFIDSAGVIHFSNVPTDSRYRLIPQDRERPYSKASLLTLINKTAQAYEVDPALIRAVVKVESDFNPDAVSYLGAQGLMQLMPQTAINLNVQDPFDPEENVGAGVRYLKYLLDLFRQEVPLALAAYHAGEKRVIKEGGIPPIKTTQHYVKRVLKFYRRYK